jgi:hypothetical protein
MPSLGEIAFFVRLLASRRDRGDAMRWWRGRRSDFPLNAAIPWIVFRAIDYLETCDLRQSLVFEYGSGGSTLFWLRKGAARVMSVEHDRGWFEAMQKRVAGKPVDLCLAEAELDGTAAGAKRADPGAYTSADPSFQRHRFTSYVRQIDAFPDETFDVVLIDGRARPSCVVHSAPKVKPGGLLILDNADRDYYLLESAPSLRGFSRQTFDGATPGAAARSTTAIFTRD